MKPSLCYAYMRARRTLASGIIIFSAAVAVLLAWSVATTPP